MSKVPLTVTGAEKLRVELHRLKTVERPWVIGAIAEARAHGDLSENAEYDAAKERQGFIEGRIQEFVAGQRDLYRYLHDQTLRMMSHGMTPAEIGEALLMPNDLSRQWFARGYYGAVAHNVAAIYAHYLGPYDGNPAHLHPLTPTAAAHRYLKYMGGADAIVQ